MSDSPATPQPDDRVTALWELHFRDPDPAFAQAQALLSEPANVDARTRAWCELTIAFHHLFFTSQPLEAKHWIAAATALMVSEFFTTAIMTILLGGMAFDGRSITVVVKTLLVCLGVTLLDWYLRPMGWGRLGIDASVYIIAVFAIGAVNIRETIRQIRRMTPQASGA